MARDQLLTLLLAVIFPVAEVTALRSAGGDTPVRHRTELAAPLVRVPLLCRSLPVVNVYVNGRGPLPFLVDTGTSGHGRVDSGLVRTLGLPVVGHTVADDGSGRRRQKADVVAVDRLALGRASFAGLRLAVGDYRRSGVAGILGIGLFEGLLLTIDGPRASLCLEIGSLPEPDGRHVVSSADDRGVPSVTVRIGRRRRPALLDTGAAAELVLPARDLPSLRCLGAPRTAGFASTAHNACAVERVTLDEPLILAGHRFTQATVSLVELFPCAVIGYELLRRRPITFDVANQRVRLG